MTPTNKWGTMDTSTSTSPSTKSHQSRSCQHSCLGYQQTVMIQSLIYRLQQHYPHRQGETTFNPIVLESSLYQHLHMTKMSPLSISSYPTKIYEAPILSFRMSHKAQHCQDHLARHQTKEGMAEPMTRLQMEKPFEIELLNKLDGIGELHHPLCSGQILIIN